MFFASRTIMCRLPASTPFNFSIAFDADFVCKNLIYDSLSFNLNMLATNGCHFIPLNTLQMHILLAGQIAGQSYGRSCQTFQWHRIFAQFSRVETDKFEESN